MRLLIAFEWVRLVMVHWESLDRSATQVGQGVCWTV
jgi:hypothetical protein